MTNPYYMPTWGSSDVSGYGDSTTGDWRYDQTQNNSGVNAQDVVGAVANGIAAGKANSVNPDDFSVNPNAGFTASNQAFSGSGGGSGGGGAGAMAAIGAATAGVTAQMGQFSNVNKKLKELDTNVQGVTYDAYGRPTYNSSSIYDANQTIDALNRGEESMSSSNSLFKGGEGIDPATRGFAALYGTKRKIRRKRQQLQQSIVAQQQNYNQADINYRNTQNQRQDYYRRMNPNGRMYNVYRAQNG